MRLNDARARQLLRAFDLPTLFIEELGWDRHAATLNVSIDGQYYALHTVAQKRGMVAYTCAPGVDGHIPPGPTRRAIERQVALTVREHLIVFHDAARVESIWQWVRREAGQPSVPREEPYHRDLPGHRLLQRLETIAFGLNEEANLTLTDVVSQVRSAFDVERVTKRFYEGYKVEHAAFTAALRGIPDLPTQRWYTSVLLNREKEFAHFIPFRNRRQREEGSQKLPSPDQCYEQGPNKGLSAPSEFQLALFGGTVRKTERFPSRKGVRYDNKWYVPASEAPEMGVLLLHAELAHRETQLLVAQIGDFEALYVQLDGKTWEPFIEASKRRWSAKKRKEWNDAVRQRLTDSQTASIERLQLALLTAGCCCLLVYPRPAKIALSRTGCSDYIFLKPDVSRWSFLACCSCAKFGIPRGSRSVARST